jgi:hypothetical protein
MFTNIRPRTLALGLFTVGALALSLLTGCSNAQVNRAIDVIEPAPAESVAPTTSLVPTNDERPAVVTVIAGDNSPVDVDPPQRLDVRYPGSDGVEQAHFQDDCDHMGGKLTWSVEFDAAGEFVCQGVDY